MPSSSKMQSQLSRLFHCAITLVKLSETRPKVIKACVIDPSGQKCRYPGMSKLLTAQDLEQRYGDHVPLTQLAEYLHTTLRALRPLLRERGVVPIEVGRVELVPLPEIELALGLTDATVLLGQLEAQINHQKFITRPDGNTKTIAELRSDVRKGAAARRAALETMR